MSANVYGEIYQHLILPPTHTMDLILEIRFVCKTETTISTISLNNKRIILHFNPYVTVKDV